MNTSEFIEKVRNMRKAQKDYFRNRLQSDLIKAKQFEKEVDQALADGIGNEAEPAGTQQMDLFDVPGDCSRGYDMTEGADDGTK